MIARRCVPELETHTAFEGINDGVKVTRKTVDRQIAMTYVWVVRFDDRQKVRVRTRDPNRFSGVIDGAMPIGDYDCGLEDSGPLLHGVCIQADCYVWVGQLLAGCCSCKVCLRGSRPHGPFLSPRPPHIPQMLATNA